jgi:hypothetical protein
MTCRAWTRLELHDPRNEGDELWDAKYHVLGGSRLLDRAVDGEMQSDLCDVGDLGLGNERAKEQGGVSAMFKAGKGDVRKLTRRGRRCQSPWQWSKADPSS